MRKIKAVFFDLGHTLLKPKRRLYNLLKKKHNLEVSLEEFRKTIGDIINTRVWNDLNDAVEAVARACRMEQSKAFKKQYKQLWLSEKKFFYKFKDAEPVLRALRERKYKLAIISNWDQFCVDVVEYYRLKHFFHHIAVSAHAGVAKPNPRLFKKVLRYFRVKPSEALMVGDNFKKDYQIAKALRMHALLLERGKQVHAGSIKSLKQVLTYLKKVNGSL